MEGGVLVAGAIAGLLSALATVIGVQLTRRTKTEADRRQRQQDDKTFLAEQRQWAEDIYTQQKQLLTECEERCTATCERLTRECTQRVEEVLADAERAARELRIQTRAQVLAAAARENYWYRAANGQPLPGEPPPPPPRGGH